MSSEDTHAPLRATRKATDLGSAMFRLDPAPTWADRGACVGVTPETADWLFFNHTAPKEAYEMCAACPVKPECRQHGLDHENHGMFGGLTRQDRLRIRGPLHTYEAYDDAEQTAS